jgi:anthranilate phosphoribosyltransferase
MSVLANPETFKPLLQKLITRPQDFSIEDTRAAIEHIAQSDGALPAQIGSFLTALHLSGKDAQPETISACAQVMRAHSIPVYLEGAREDFVVDIVGTGGDGHNTFNVSTAAAIVAAGAGARVCKVRLCCST